MKPPRLDALHVSDSELVDRVGAGDRNAYAELVRRHQDRLYRYALAMAGEAAAMALVEATFIEAFATLDRCSDRARFGFWLFRLHRDRCLSRPDAPMERSPWSGMRSFLGALPATEREAFVLRHVEGLGYEAMAELLEQPASVLKDRVHEARDRLERLLRAPALAAV